MNIIKWKNIPILLVYILIGCTSQHEETEADLSFSKDAIYHFNKVALFKSKTVIPLETKDDILIDRYPSLLLDEDFFIYSKKNGGKILRFDPNGKFKNSIGQVGSGPEEFVEATDINVDTENKTIDILALNAIYEYTYTGDFINKIQIEQPAFSFYKESKELYWLYVGNNVSYNDFRLFKVNDKDEILDSYLKNKYNLLPISETNFHKTGDLLTFHESFNNDLYMIAEGNIKKVHTVSFGNMNLNLDNAPKDPIDFISYLNQNHYAMVRNYLENKNYIYLQISEHIPNSNENKFYHWFINKKNHTNTIVEQPANIPSDSYLYTPQVLTADNKLYFLGYILEKEDDEIIGEENPSVVIVNIENL